MPVTFHKMHGLGNDFILLDLRKQAFPVNSSTVKQLANRHTGIGCDQLLILREPKDNRHLASFEIWNSDGSSCEQCGNGVRCMGRYLDMRAEAPGGGFTLAGPAGTVTIECQDNGLVRVDMGSPVFDAKRVPIQAQAVDGWYLLDIDGQEYRIGAVSMGNPHALLVVDDIRSINVGELGAAFGSHPAFPEGCNMGFAEISDRSQIELRVFERGAAETLACGSGACAAVSILRRANLVDSNVKVTQAGGDLIISWSGGREPVIMTGPATHVFKGNWT
jgi:diaminopimelate epimerase